MGISTEFALKGCVRCTVHMVLRHYRSYNLEYKEVLSFILQSKFCSARKSLQIRVLAEKADVRRKETYQ